MTNQINTTPETEAAVADAENILMSSRDFRITDAGSMEAANDNLRQIKSKIKDLNDRRLAMTRPLDDTKKQIMDFFRAPLMYLDDAERLIKRAMLAYQAEEQCKRDEQERALREKARKEQERLEKRAAAAESKGQIEKAETLREQAETMPMPVVAHEAHKPDGISYRETWSAEVVDKMALIKAVAAGQVPDIAIDVNMKVINAQARSLKGSLNWPGIKSVSERIVASR